MIIFELLGDLIVNQGWTHRHKWESWAGTMAWADYYCTRCSRTSNRMPRAEREQMYRSWAATEARRCPSCGGRGWSETMEYGGNNGCTVCDGFGLMPVGWKKPL